MNYAKKIVLMLALMSANRGRTLNCALTLLRHGAGEK